MDYRLWMLYRICRNFCIEQEVILHNMTALLESNRFKNEGVIDEHTFLHRKFSKELIEYF